MLGCCFSSWAAADRSGADCWAHWGIIGWLVVVMWRLMGTCWRGMPDVAQDGSIHAGSLGLLMLKGVEETPAVT